MPTLPDIVASWRRVMVPAYRYTCTRCDYAGLSVIQPSQEDRPPRRCGRCKSPYWHTSRGLLPIGQGRRKR